MHNGEGGSLFLHKFAYAEYFYILIAVGLGKFCSYLFRAVHVEAAVKLCFDASSLKH